MIAFPFPFGDNRKRVSGTQKPERGEDSPDVVVSRPKQTNYVRPPCTTQKKTDLR